MDRCKNKVLYDTEFEATIAAAKKGYDWKEEMIPYPCGRHWHIAHQDRSLRNRHIRKTYCEVCDCEIANRRGRYQKHEKTGKHQHLLAVARKAKEKEPS